MALRRLIVIHLAGIALATAASLIDIESIVASGPLLSCSGAVIALLCFRRQCVFGYYLGLSTPTFSLICFAMIYGFSWAPSHAQRPIAALIFVYMCVALPSGIASLGALPRSFSPVGVRFRFRITSVLVVTTAIAIALGAQRQLNVGIAAFGLLTGYMILAVHVSIIFHARQVEPSSFSRATAAPQPSQYRPR